MKNYIGIYITILAVMLTASCKKFIDEKQVSILTNDYYNTEQGVEDLVKSAYERTRIKFEYEQAYALWNFGVDEFTIGDQFNFEWFNKYDSRLNPGGGTGETYLSDLWSANYDGINRCNLGLERIPIVPGVRLLATSDQRKQRMAELRFLRGYYYFQLVQQFGGLPITTISSEGIRTEFPRSSVAETYLQIIGDLKMAADSLNPTTTEFGRATKAAAMHFLAKAYLTRGSAIAEQRGQKATDMDSAAYYAEQVISGVAGGGFVLATDYKDLWKGVYPEDNPTWILPTLGNSGVAPVAPNTSAYTTSINAQKSKEILFSAQWNNKPALTGRFGNQTHMYFGCAYENSPSEVGVTRDVHGGRPFRRLQPTDYAMDIYDRKNDSRFYKEFRVVHYSNVNQTSARFTAANAPDPSFVGKTRFGIGDTAILFLMNKPENPVSIADLDFAAGSKFRYKVYARYWRDTGGNLKRGFGFGGVVPSGANSTTSSQGKYLTLIKYQDPFRAAFNDQAGFKDGILARLGETYLIAAEANGRKSAPDFVKALTYINALRTRAAYKANERRPEAVMFEGVLPTDVASTTTLMQATDVLWTTNAASEMYPASAATSQQRFIHFILNERARELCGELYRWEDLVRTETLVTRTRQFNTDAALGIQDYHKLRPVPQREIDLTTINGATLTPEQKKAYQNPGY
jgi:hypothetical protein